MARRPTKRVRPWVVRFELPSVYVEHDRQHPLFDVTAVMGDAGGPYCDASSSVMQPGESLALVHNDGFQYTPSALVLTWRWAEGAEPERLEIAL